MSSIPDIPVPYAETFRDPKGPNDARPTGFQIIKDEGLIGKLSDKTILVTGGTDGLGLESVRQLAKTGAHIFFTARSEMKAEKVMQELRKEGETDADLKGARLDWIKMDLSSLKSVRAGAQDFMSRSKHLNILLANAGIASTPYRLTEDGHEEQFAVNHLAHFLLFTLLKPLLLSSSTASFNSRVVAVSSSAHSWSTVQIDNYNLDKKLQYPWNTNLPLKGDHNPMIAYGQSKTANIWFTTEIQRRYGRDGLHGIAVHPGGIFTSAFGKMDDRIRETLGGILSSPKFAGYMKSPEQGVATQILVAIGKSYEGKGGFFVEDCGISQPQADGTGIAVHGHASWAFDAEGARRLWSDSFTLVGLTDDS